MAYKVFQYDSHNSGRYVSQDLRLNYARAIARGLSVVGAKKARVEGESGFFEQYEKGEKTEWSFISK